MNSIRVDFPLYVATGGYSIDVLQKPARGYSLSLWKRKHNNMLLCPANREVKILDVNPK